MSRNAVRRHLRRDPGLRRPEKKRLLDAKQELDLVTRVARRYRIPNPEDLESELIAALVKAYPRKTTVDDWKAFLAKSLYNAALNWLRGRNRYGKRVTSSARPPQPEDEHDVKAVDWAAALGLNLDDRLALERVLETLPSFLRSVWDAMLAAKFDQTEAARLLGVHRNTIGKALHQIGIILRQHGF